MLIRQVARTVQRFGMICPGDRVLVAVSGGPDSVALTHVLHELRRHPALGPFEMILAHLNHRLRIEADEDEAFCEQLAGALGLKFISQQVDVAREARRRRCSLEEAGRLARYAFLGSAAQRLGCGRIAVGHTRNDQAETLLLHMLRGSGTAGLAAIHPIARGMLIRPLLESHRQQVLRFLAERSLSFRSDGSNEDCAFARNRIRHRALPFLEEEFNPGLVETLARTADLLRDDQQWMEQEATRTLEQVGLVESPERGWELSAPSLAALHPALARRVIRRAIQLTKGDLRSIGARHVENVLLLALPGKSGRRLALPGVEIRRSFDRLWFRPARPSRAECDASGDAGQGRPGQPQKRHCLRPESWTEDGYNGYEYELPVPGRVAIPEAGGVIEAEEAVRSCLPAAVGRSVVVGVPDGVEIHVGFKVRSPRVGDRFRPLGAPGTKSVSRYLMEHRVGRDRRHRIPLVIGADQEVVWVAGLGISEWSRVRPGARRLVHLSWVEG